MIDQAVCARPFRSKASASDGRIIITGTGRTGTTFLVQLFSELGFDTGYRPEEALCNIDALSQAGLERPLLRKDNPYVIKSPWFSNHLQKALEKRKIKIYMAIIPVRDLFEAAESRRRVSAEAAKAGLNVFRQHGGIWLTLDPAEQEDKLARQFYKSVFPLIEFDIPFIFLHFPRFVRDSGYLYYRLRPLLDDHGVDEAEFTKAYAKVVRPEAVHTFDEKSKTIWPHFSRYYALMAMQGWLIRRLWGR